MSEYSERYKYWKRKNLEDSKRHNVSIRKELKDKDLIDSIFEYKLNNISLENIIALKMELMADSLDSKMFGFPVWKKSVEIMKDALMRFAVSVTESKREASVLLGVNRKEVYKYLKEFDIEELFPED